MDSGSPGCSWANEYFSQRNRTTSDIEQGESAAAFAGQDFGQPRKKGVAPMDVALPGQPAIGKLVQGDAPDENPKQAAVGSCGESSTYRLTNRMIPHTVNLHADGQTALRPKPMIEIGRGSQPLRQYTPVQSTVTIDSVMACACRKSSTARRQFGSAP